MSNDQPFAADAPGPMDDAERAVATQLAVDLGQAYRDAGQGGSTSPFEGEGISRRINVRTLTERLRINTASTDLGEGDSIRPDWTTNRTQRDVWPMDPHANANSVAHVSQVNGNRDQQMGSSCSQQSGELRALVNRSLSARGTPLERFSLSEVIEQTSTTQGHSDGRAGLLTANLPEEETRPSQEHIAVLDPVPASVELARMLMQAYHEVENPPGYPFEGQGTAVSVTINVPELISQLRLTRPQLDGINAASPSSDPLEQIALVTPASATFEDGIRVASASRDSRAAMTLISAAIAAATPPENASGTVTMRDPDNDDGANGVGREL
ncbi:hypothetical protein FRB98_009697 [Tulasnella sp. 332]|nr:hypothetical protein FRB98_009697 [Tulasnella sp. 332]